MKIGYTVAKDSRGSCIYCGKASANYFCNRCNLTTSYCSKQCQASDWKRGGGNHKQLCQLLQTNVKESLLEDMISVIQDLLDMENEWIQSLSLDELTKYVPTVLQAYDLTRRLESEEPCFSNYSVSGACLMVLLRVNSCDYRLHYENNKISAFYWFFDFVLKPWFRKHKKTLKSEGFELHRFGGEYMDDGVVWKYSGYVFKDNRSADIDRINALCARTTKDCPYPRVDLGLFSKAEINRAMNSWTTSNPSLCVIIYWFVDPTDLSNDLGCFVSPIEPENAKEVGEHFAKSRNATPCIGIDLNLEINKPFLWPDTAIVETWLGAAEHDAQKLLDWLDQDQVVSTFRIPSDRMRRIKKLIQEKL